MDSTREGVGGAAFARRSLLAEGIDVAIAAALNEDVVGHLAVVWAVGCVAATC